MDLQTRVKRRVEELGQSPITLAKSVGLERGYINDIVIGRERSVRADKLDLVAQALGVSVGYLQGMDDAVMVLPELQTKTINAICETGVWRTPQASALPAAPPLKRLMPGHYEIFLARGDAMEGAHILDGMTVVGVEHDRFVAEHGVIPTGSIVVATRAFQQANSVETALWKIVRGHETRLVACPPTGRHYDDVIVERPVPGISLRITSVAIMAVNILVQDIDMTPLT